MKLATLLRHVDMKENEVWDSRFYITRFFPLLAEENGVGLCAILTKYDIEDVCDICDGLIIPGSAKDIDPKYFGGTPFNPPQEVDEYALDSKAIECFEKAGKPIFGICGGFQDINIYFGGDIVKNTDGPNHYGAEVRHEIDIVKGSFVYDVFGSEKAVVNSYHNWKLGRVADGFDVVARSVDGVVEAIENKEKKIFATEWHPELSYHNGDVIERKFFKNFVECCRKNSQK